MIITDLLFLTEFFNLDDKRIVDKDGDIFIFIVEYYSIEQPSDEKESSDKEEEVKEIDITVVL